MLSTQNMKLLKQKNAIPKKVFLKINSINKQLYDDLIELRNDSSNQLKQSIYENVQPKDVWGNAEHIAIFYFPIVSHILYYCPEYTEDLLPLILDPLLCIIDIERDETHKLIETMQEIVSMNSKRNTQFITIEGENWIENKLTLHYDFLNNFLEKFHDE